MQSINMQKVHSGNLWNGRRTYQTCTKLTAQTCSNKVKRCRCNDNLGADTDILNNTLESESSLLILAFDRLLLYNFHPIPNTCFLHGSCARYLAILLSSFSSMRLSKHD